MLVLRVALEVSGLNRAGEQLGSNSSRRRLATGHGGRAERNVSRVSHATSIRLQVIPQKLATQKQHQRHQSLANSQAQAEPMLLEANDEAAVNVVDTMEVEHLPPPPPTTAPLQSQAQIQDEPMLPIPNRSPGPRRSTRIAQQPIRTVPDVLPAATRIPLPQLREIDTMRSPSPTLPVVDVLVAASSNTLPVPGVYVATEPDDFGVFAVFKELPQCLPTTNGEDEAFDAATFNVTPEVPHGSCGPFKNWSIFSLLHWAYDTTVVTASSLNKLVHDVILEPRFNREHLNGFNAHREMRRLDESMAGGSTPGEEDASSDPEHPQDEWREGNSSSGLAKARSQAAEAEAPLFEVAGMAEMNIKGHILMVNSSHGPERVHGEAYTADALLQFEEEIRNRPDADSCTLETVVVAWIIHSDATHLANFGTASMWPIYGWVANYSKYLRAKPSKMLARHLAYIPKVVLSSWLPDEVYDEYHRVYGTAPTRTVIAQLRRDLFQAVWRLILTPELARAYCHGEPATCGEGTRRQAFIRLLINSNDYPEKMLLAAIRTMTPFICPCCNTTVDLMHLMGTKSDAARRQKL
ncbi:hypothetical protein MIND_01433400 [Mycena indigotica]|uniref:Uncharacterized protein n=1 Tax=Mycena indigotica TaxID=2126181 RepID=A0A8H6VQM5_9AGAR|nr:uncharacterized protein MIND_01433400 [Mycena indigotica]KAF7288451.1 hypothetical protein MIND_01433400 [Mycena indigotica]